MREQVAEALLLARSRRAWQELSLAELVAAVDMQFVRMQLASKRWPEKNPYSERISEMSNRTIRDLLLSKPHLIPEDPLPDAAELIVHYDVWLEEFDRRRGEGKESSVSHVFVPYKGYGVPHQAATRFRAATRTHEDKCSRAQRTNRRQPVPSAA